MTEKTSNPKSSFNKKRRYDISKAHPFEDALGYIEAITRKRDEWPIDRLTQVKIILAELDKVMEEYSDSVNPSILPKENHG